MLGLVCCLIFEVGFFVGVWVCCFVCLFFSTCYKISFMLIKVKFISFIFSIQGSFKNIGLLGSCLGSVFCLDLQGFGVCLGIQYSWVCCAWISL